MEQLEQQQVSFINKIGIKGWLAIIFVLCLSLECFVFNHSFFFETRGEQIEINLPFNEQLGRRAAVVTPQNPQITIQSINKPVHRVRVETVGNEAYITGQISLTEDASSVIKRNVNTFAVNPGGDKNVFTAAILPNGNTHDLTIAFKDLHFPIALTSIEFNAPTEFSFSFVRFLFFEILLSLIYLTFKLKWYEVELNFESKRQKIVNLACMGFCLGVSLFFFAFTNPMTSTPMVWDMPSYDSLQLGNPQHSLLLPYPQTREELKQHDIFVKQMDAFNKGQLNFDVIIDPRQALAPNPYDQGYLMANGIDYYFEASFYDGKYYSYYGLAPIFTIYYPIYILTGKVPSPGLTCGLLSFFSVITLFFAMGQVFRYFNIKKANALLFYCGEVAVIFASLIYLNQAMLRHYQIQVLTMTFYLGLFLGCTFKYLRCEFDKTYKRILFLVLLGLITVMLVMTRQLAFIMAVGFVAVPLLKFLFEKIKKDARSGAYDIAALGVPVLVGAVCIMAYNYARFGSVFDFGFAWQITGADHHYDHLRYSLQVLSSAVFHYLWDQPDWLRSFPFVYMKTLEFNDHGLYLYTNSTMGLFGISLMTALFLGWFLYFKTGKASAAKYLAYDKFGILRKMFTINFILVMATVHLALNVASGMCQQYLTDYTASGAIIVLVLIVLLVHYDTNVNSSVLMFIIAGMFIQTCLLGFFLPLDEGGLLPGMNPDLYIWIKNLFNPFSI